MQLAQNSTYSKKFKFLAQSWFSGLTRISFAPVTRSSVNVESHYANTNDLLNVTFRWRKPFVNRYQGSKDIGR